MTRFFRCIAGLWITLVLVGCLGPQDATLNGELAWDRVELIAELDEPIMTIVAREGERLEAGAAVLQQDDRRVAAQLAQARATQDEAAARLAELERGPRPERISAAQARLAGAEAEADNAGRELTRLQSLQRRNLASEEALDLARTRRSASRAALAVARAELEELQNGATREELDQARARVAQARALTQQLNLTLERLSVRAPRAGLLDELPFEVGERPPAGKVIAVLLTGPAPYARVYVPEPMRASLGVGDAARISVDGLDGDFDGRIRRISSDPSFTPFESLTERDRSRLSFVAEVELEGDGLARLPGGLPVRVSFPGVSP
ncbi:MAG: HlyD family efflux transporter periplasmic adaptor subunit [Oceanospirillaceae bacterium]|nr:HlyD family efflux transporter periplasmic adaptor subunit [Oceanospirillaceae bacterium]